MKKLTGNTIHQDMQDSLSLLEVCNTDVYGNNGLLHAETVPFDIPPLLAQRERQEHNAVLINHRLVAALNAKKILASPEFSNSSSINDIQAERRHH